jgi:hypothetical protein
VRQAARFTRQSTEFPLPGSEDAARLALPGGGVPSWLPLPAAAAGGAGQEVAAVEEGEWGCLKGVGRRFMREFSEVSPNGWLLSRRGRMLTSECQRFGHPPRLDK